MESAFEIASESLRGNYAEKGILAGKKNYPQYWLRDFAFASFGSIALGDKEIVKKSLEEFASKMDDGKVPMRVRHSSAGWMIWDGIFESRFHADKPPFSYAIDSNPLFVIALGNYFSETGDREFIEKMYPAAKEAIEHLQTLEENCLLPQGIYGDWADTLKKDGFVSYANICYYKALESMSEFCDALGKGDIYAGKASKLKERIISEFWNGEYFEDMDGRFDTASNALACLWLLADEEKDNAEKIFSMTEMLAENNVPLPSMHPPYPRSKVSWDAGIAKNSGFHNGDSWLWIGCVDALAKKKFGFDGDAEKELDKIADAIEKYGDVYEVYSCGKPTKTGGVFKPLKIYPLAGYEADRGWSWSSGLFVKAWKEIKG